MIALLLHWLITYLLHSSVLLGSALVLDRRRRLATRGVGTWPWRIALYGAFVTAMVQTALLDLSSPPAMAQQANGAAGTAAALDSTLVLTVQGDITDLAPFAIAAWLVAGGVALGYLCTRWIRLRRTIDGLPPLASDELRQFAAMISARAGFAPPELRVGTPFAVPIVGPGRIVCIPPWMLDDYQTPRLHSALAHEIGHLRRRDNAWRIADRMAALAGWLQPLNRIALRRLDESAEIACDAWAADATGLRRELAECLEDCAQRLCTSRADPGLAVTMASARTPLLQRVLQLLEGPDMNMRKFRRAAVWSSVTIAVAAAAVVFVVVRALDDDAPPRWLAKMGLYESLRNSGENVQNSRSVIIDSPDRYVFVRVTGDFSLQPQTLADEKKGVAIIAETRGGTTRSVRFERKANQEIRRIYKIDGRIHELDADGARWIADMLPIASL